MRQAALPCELKGERIFLKRHTLDIAEHMFRCMDQERERLREYLPWVDSTLLVADTINFINMSIEQWQRSRFDYGIFRKSDSLYMGNCGVIRIAWEHDRCEIGYYILKDFEGQGYVSEAIRILEDAVFELGLNRIEIRCTSTNALSENLSRRWS